MGKKKWQIDNLNDRIRYRSASRIVLRNRFSQLQDDINSYLSDETVEGLHKVRISLRRLRYSMELFVSCYDNKKFMILYRKIKALQVLSGKVRDLDVMKENMSILSTKEKMFSVNEGKRLDDFRNELALKLRLDLRKFIQSKAVKSFRGLL